MSNLEPIEDIDLDLKNKFAGDAEKAPESNNEKREEKKIESPVFPEKLAERKEIAMEKEAAYSKILSKVKTTSSSSDDAVADDAQVTSEKLTAEHKIETLVNLAMKKGIVHAVKVARHLDDNYVLDEFHDRLLAEELHKALISKGLIEEK